MGRDSETEVPPGDLPWSVRTAVYRHFAETGRAPSTDGLATAVGTTPDRVRGSLDALAREHLIVLAPGTGHVWMAHPFSAVPTPYPVLIGRRRYWANCAWDAFAIPGLLGEDARIETRCAESAEPMAIAVEEGQVRGDGGVVHFAVPPRRFWENVAFT